MSSHTRKILECRVAARNNANAYAAEIYPKLVAVFASLVGQKLFKANCNLFEKIQKSLPDLRCDSVRPGLHVFRNSDSYSLSWTVRGCESIDGNGNRSEEVTLYIGKLDAVGKLTEICPAPVFPVYTANDIEAKRAVYQQAKVAAQHAESALFPFGEYDRG